MDVVGQYAIAKPAEAETLVVLVEEFQAHAAVVINEEHLPPVMATLNNVVPLTRNDDFGRARFVDG